MPFDTVFPLSFVYDSISLCVYEVRKNICFLEGVASCFCHQLSMKHI